MLASLLVVDSHAAVRGSMVQELRELGHEVAHILSGHALYHTMLYVLVRGLRWVFPMPVLAASVPIRTGTW